jgi:hypothetical protein
MRTPTATTTTTTTSCGIQQNPTPTQHRNPDFIGGGDAQTNKPSINNNTPPPSLTFIIRAPLIR